ncbi:hypothetical protein THASP1DRAFT_32864 [Thamnocephalis sphaerospora]|uniref:Wax synthase domain-containing protein n=1 Tax=Thamnocephalis sphaerospora TaxID=78915 RepID=A0A4V1IVU7_9FUNG|nr:hypothetical protein THASP1DRAFT_32864 [Thamnocephalis sphaerospora]|eukprot:RKP05299.1 hypothetical protein THASP1DRAFT_32864 [Thamnocephalis sphaerospora]
MAFLFMFYFFTLTAYALVFDLLMLITGETRRKDIHVRPWMAASPRELWSARWNLQMQGTLASAIYLPMCHLLDTIAAFFIRAAVEKTSTTLLHAACSGHETTKHDGSITLARGMQHVNRYIAALVVFFVSAVNHEMLVISYFGGTDGDHMRFFCFQGALVFVYSIVETLLAAILSTALMPHGHLPFIVGWPIVVASLAATGHWFFRPFIRAGTLDYLLNHYALV